MAKKRARKRAVNVPLDLLPPEKLDKYPAVLVKYFNRWKKMKVWETDLSDVSFILQKRSENQSTGLTVLTHCNDCQVIVRAGLDKFDSLVCVLHEIAHSACFRRDIDDGHGKAWQDLFLKAASRVLKTKIVPERNMNGYFEVHSSIVKAFREKFKL